MAYFQLADKQVALRAGEMTVGSGAGMDIPVAEAPSPSAMAVVTMKGDGAVSVRRGFEGAPVKVNGVQLGVEPTPLIHGDKLEVAGHELQFGDDKKSGSTQFLSGTELAELAKLRQQAASAASAKAGVPTASTGGRLVSLTDGREYQISSKGLSFGRDASCDVVIASGEVSRNHAEISSGPDGYYIIDTSTNGIWVNSKRVDGTQTLARADVIRVGPEEFRFYADKASAAAGAATVAPSAAPAPAVAPLAPKPVLATTAEEKPLAPPPAAPKPAPAPAPVAAPAAAPTVAPSAPPPPAEAQKGSPIVLIVLGVVAVGAALAYFLLK